MNQKKIFIFLSILGLISCFPSILSAWFSGAREVTQPFYQHLSETSSDPELFYLYDSAVSGQDRPDSPYLMPSTRDFVPADRININMPLQTLYERSFSSSDSLDALLNANLSLQLLLEQYKDLQKRTAELLKSLNISYLEKLGEKTIKNMDISFNEGSRSAKLDVQNTDIRLQTAELSHQISETVRNKPVGTFYLSDKEIPSFAGLKAEEEVEMSSGKKVFSVADTGLQIIKNGAALQSGSRVVSNFSGTSEEGVLRKQSSGTTYNDQVDVNRTSGQNELPWIFRVVLSTAGYVAANKIEATFYGMILFFICYLISLKTRE